MRKAVAKNKSTPADLLVRLATDPDEEIRLTVTDNGVWEHLDVAESLPTARLMGMLDEEHPFVRLCAACLLLLRTTRERS